MQPPKERQTKYQQEAPKVRRPAPTRKQILRELGRDLIDAQRNGGGRR